MSRSGADAAAPAAAPPAPSRRRWLRISPGLIAALLGAAVYLDTLPNDFTYDDHPIIVYNPRVRDWTSFSEIWLRDWWFSQYSDVSLTDPHRDRLYRPLTFFTFAVQYAIHGFDPLPFHAVNLALHALACLLVVRLAGRILAGRRAALLAGLLFAVHPIHVEAVANIVGRAEVLATVFILLALLAVAPARGRVTAVRIAGAALATFAALLCKETAISTPAIAVILLFWRERMQPRGPSAAAPPLRRRPVAAAILAFTIVIGAYLPLRYVALDRQLMRTGGVDPTFNPVVKADSVVSRFVTLPLTILGRYTGLMVAPATLSYDYGYAIIDPQQLPDGYTLLGAVAALLLLAGLIRWRTRAGLLAWMFVASYALISNSLLVIGVSLAERLFYWPSVVVILGFALGIDRAWAWITSRTPERAALARILAAAVVAALALVTLIRNTDWADNLRLTLTDVASHPRGVMLSEAAARQYLVEAMKTTDPRTRAALLEQADKYVEQSLRLDRSYPEALRTKGTICWAAGDLPHAIEYLDLAVKLQPNVIKTQALLAEIRRQAATSRPDLEGLRARVAAAPDDWAARADLARALRDAGEAVDACAQFAALAAHDPANAEFMRSYGELLAVTFRDAEAIDVLKKAAALAPDDWQTQANLARLLARSDPAASLEHARRAVALRPDSIDARMNLAAALVFNNKTDEAIAVYSELLRLLPPDHPNRGPIQQVLEELNRSRKR